MNQLEQEKKLVAEFMGWKIDSYVRDGVYHTDLITNRGSSDQGLRLPIQEWSPQKDRNAWPEIWDMMNWRMIKEYDKNLVQMHYDNAHPTATGGFGEDTELALRWKSHRAKPEVCWQALIKTLEGE
tara:strand:- start:676 stop:1053 length:378 start_codon:yes stop_codon:yes gene_type:complete